MDTETTTPPIITPADPGYDDARRAWNLAADQRPAAVATAGSAAEAAALVRLARAQGLRVAPQGTGHSAAAMPDLADALLLRTAIEPRVVVDPAARSVRVGAGTVWKEVVEALAPHGLAALAGSAHDVGVVGYVLGGGMSWLGRRHGLASDHVTACEVVTADGEIAHVDAASEPELFWALRGGGGNFAVVTAVELEAFELAEVHAGIAIWDGAHAAEILRRWLTFTRSAPETVTTAGRILQLPPLPEVPEPLRARPLVAIDGAALGGAAEALELLGSLREIGEPLLDTWGPMPPSGLIEIHLDPPGPVPGIGDHLMLGALDDAALGAFLDAAGPGSGSPLLAAELRHAGGAMARENPGGGAARLKGEFSLYGVGALMDPAAAPAIRASLERLVGALAPWATDRTYLNYVESGVGAEGSFDPETYARLQQVRAAYDPGELFVSGHRIAPRAAG